MAPSHSKQNAKLDNCLRCTHITKLVVKCAGVHIFWQATRKAESWKPWPLCGPSRSLCPISVKLGGYEATGHGGYQPHQKAFYFLSFPTKSFCEFGNLLLGSHKELYRYMNQNHSLMKASLSFQRITEISVTSTGTLVSLGLTVSQGLIIVMHMFPFRTGGQQRLRKIGSASTRNLKWKCSPSSLVTAHIRHQSSGLLLLQPASPVEREMCEWKSLRSRKISFSASIKIVCHPKCQAHQDQCGQYVLLCSIHTSPALLDTSDTLPVEVSSLSL